MPSKNIVKQYGDNMYYHVYNRGVNKDRIFIKESDYKYFLWLLKRHLGLNETYDKYGRPYKHLSNSVSILSYCLMPNHFHLLVLNKQGNGLEQLMRSVATAYSRYFNQKFERIGPVFQSNFKASMISSDAYLQHISRYIHRNPKVYKGYSYSSYQAIVHNWAVEWLDDDALMETFEGSRQDYAEFVADYEDYKDSLQDIELDLADR